MHAYDSRSETHSRIFFERHFLALFPGFLPPMLLERIFTCLSSNDRHNHMRDKKITDNAFCPFPFCSTRLQHYITSGGG